MRRFVAVLLFLAASGLSAQTLKDLAAQVGAQVYWEPYRGQVLLTGPGHRLSVDLSTGLALGDEQTVFELSTLVPNTAMLAPEEFSKLLNWWRDQAAPTVTFPEPQAEPKSDPGSPGGPRVQVIVLDAGHGGTDPGSLGRHVIDGKTVVLQEKDLTLAVVLELQKLLIQAYPGRTIALTRKNDSYPTLEQRVQIADSQKLSEKESILFLSVHFNASLSKKAKGIEFWYVPQNYEREVIAGGDIPESMFPVLNTLVDTEYKKESRELAVQLAKGMAKELGDSNVQRGLKENPWFVVRMARMPAVLAELGFITNLEEATLMTDPEYLKKLAHGLYTGLVSFIQAYEEHS